MVEGEDGEELWLRAVVASPDGVRSIRRSAVGSVADPAALGVALAAELLAEGAAELVGRTPVASGTGMEGER